MEDENFLENLIENVKKRKCLFDKKDAFYFNRKNKEKAWREVAEICGKSDSECKHRWKLLRERFCKELKRLEAPSGSGMNYLEEWRFLQPMMFLKDSVTPRRTRDNVDTDTDSVLEQSVSSCSFHESSAPPLKKPKTSLDSLCHKFGETLEKIERQMAAPTEPTGTDEAFMTTVICLMKDLPVAVKDNFQADTLMELYRLRRENRQTDT